MTGLLLTEEQAELLTGQMYDYRSYFAPIKDSLDRYILSIEERNNCVNAEYDWVNDLPEVEFELKEDNY